MKGAKPLTQSKECIPFFRRYPPEAATVRRSRSGRSRHGEAGFTIAELTVVIVLVGIVTIVLYTIFNTSFLNYLGLEKDSSQFNTIAQQSQRVATVVRGLTDITAADDNDMQFYAYFSPNDSYVSLIHYYLTGSSPSLMADVTPISANPPTGTLLVAKKRTYTIIDKFKNQPSTPLFEYLDSVGTTLAQPISDLHVIKGVRINLTQDLDNSRFGNVYNSSLTVSLRNRKTNL
jgi:hypothetical protein